MKKLIILSLLLVSCNNTNTPIIDSSKPFIVTNIESIRGNGMSKYSNHSTDFINQSIILPSRMYNIGDTISFLKILKKDKKN